MDTKFSWEVYMSRWGSKCLPSASTVNTGVTGWSMASFTGLTLVLSSSRVKTHWATRRRQPSLLTASCCATSQVMPMLFKSCCMLQFFSGVPGFLFVPLISQCTACLGSLLSSIRRTCPSHHSQIRVLFSFVVISVCKRREHTTTCF